MPAVLKRSEMFPARSTAISPPSPPIGVSWPLTTWSVACARLTPVYCMREQTSRATVARMKYSPCPVALTAQERLSA
jgi:hypothetical protein